MLNRLSILRNLLFTGCLITCCGAPVFSQVDKTSLNNKKATDTIAPVVTNGVEFLQFTNKGYTNRVPAKHIWYNPYSSLQQMLKGNAAGLYVQEPSGEPGTDQNVFIRGIASPMLSKRDLYDNQAAVFINGIPVIQDNPFAYEIQQYDFNRIGPATNVLASLNPNNIESIEVIKDPVSLASLGPIAANGAIWVTTKNAHSGLREISVNAYYGMTQKPTITSVNAAYENNFRRPFYDRYGSINDRLNYPSFLRDSTNSDYYGAANWGDLYYDHAALFSADLSLTGGSERANFRFFGSAAKNANPADATSINRYTGTFSINVAPLKWLMVSSMINYSRLDRTRNRNFRDRFAEQRYVPDLSNPLPANKNIYSNYLSEFNNSVDDNSTNVIQGYLAVSANVGKIKYNGRFGFDYNEGTRDAFWPTQLLEGNNFVSSYFGYNQRFVLSNTLGYNFKLGDKQSLYIEGGQNYMADVYKYDYAYAYNGPNNFIKINIVDGNPNNAGYLQPGGFTAYYFPDKMQSNLASFYGSAAYNFNDALKLKAIVRRDGSSNLQPDHKWFTNYSAGAEWNLLKSFFGLSSKMSELNLTASWARIGKLFTDDRYSNGPNYRVDLGWSGEPTIGSYSGIPGVSRPYSYGWVGYGIPWSYTDQFNAGVRAGAFHNRLRLAVDVYNKDNKNMLLSVPVAAEYGYTGAYESGMAVNNKGIDASLEATIIQPQQKSFGWVFTANINYNKNKLKALPGRLDELITGTSKLVVGQPIDAFWLLKNEGIYNTDADVPVNPATSQKLTYQGVALKAGDPRWADVNGDYVINDKDKVLTGNYLPKLTGGFGSNIDYKGFSLNFQFYFALGRKALNQYASNHLDFINNEAGNNINSVKEITYWEKKQDLSGYPLYNPWSGVAPYRLGQDLFLDDASFLKLRSLSIAYDFAKGNSVFANKKTFRHLVLYLSATNLFTVSSFKADDPELVNYNGIYTGYGLPIPRSLIVGLKMDL